jgi:hypothetical protein
MTTVRIPMRTATITTIAIKRDVIRSKVFADGLVTAEPGPQAPLSSNNLSVAPDYTLNLKSITSPS